MGPVEFLLLCASSLLQYNTKPSPIMLNKIDSPQSILNIAHSQQKSQVNSSMCMPSL